MAQRAIPGGSIGPGTQPGTDHLVDHHEEHPGPSVYVRVAVILAIITAVEVAVYYIDWMHDTGALVPTLLVLSAIKFTAVVGFFMHLRYDDRRLTWTFVAGLIVALSIVLALYTMFHFHKTIVDFYINTVNQQQ